jgi:hypothetical protein
MAINDIILVGSPWGAGTFAKRYPTDKELKMARCQGMAFYEVVSRVRWGKQATK